MKKEKQQGQMSTYSVQCGDATRGTISAHDPDDARERAEEMCRVHQGVQPGGLERGKIPGK